MNTNQLLAQLLPVAIVALVFWRRWRSMSRSRPLRTASMWIAPALYVALVGGILWAMPPVALGWLLFAGALVAGCALGWQRARLLHLHIEGGTVMMRQSLAGLAVIIGIFAARRLYMASGGGAGGSGPGMHHALPLATDALLGLALGSVVGYRIELWRRARALAAGHAAAAEPPATC